jgi:hypothetical protein
MKKQIVRLALGSALALAFTLPMAHVTFGDTAEDCHRKLESDRARIDRDAARHGENSGQVNRDVARMDGDRNWCRDHHSDWDHDRFDVGIYFKH